MTAPAPPPSSGSATPGAAIGAFALRSLVVLGLPTTLGALLADAPLLGFLTGLTALVAILWRVQAGRAPTTRLFVVTMLLTLMIPTAPAIISFVQMTDMRAAALRQHGALLEHEEDIARRAARFSDLFDVRAARVDTRETRTWRPDMWLRTHLFHAPVASLATLGTPAAISGESLMALRSTLAGDRLVTISESPTGPIGPAEGPRITTVSCHVSTDGTVHIARAFPGLRYIDARKVDALAPLVEMCAVFAAPGRPQALFARHTR